MKAIILLSFSLFVISVQSHDSISKSADGASVFIVSPKDGETVSSTFLVKFGIQGMEVSPAGTFSENTGHHHLLIDGKQLPDMKLPLGSSVTHFGKGQTETNITLDKGKHTLQLILGNHLHVPHNPPVISKVITIEVE